MKSAIRECADDTVDAIVVWGSYKQSRIAGKFNRREHFREALVSAQDSTGGHIALFPRRDRFATTRTRCADTLIVPHPGAGAGPAHHLYRR